MRKWKKLLWVVLILAGVAGLSGVAYHFFTGARKGRDIGGLLAQRDRHLKDGNKFQAYAVMRQVADLQPQNAKFLRDTGILALEAGKKETANHYLSRAWSAGERDIKTMAALVESSTLPTKDKQKFLFSLIAQIPDPVRAEELRAFTYFQRNEFEKAEPLFLHLYQTNHKTIAAEYRARCLIGAKMPDQARTFLKHEATENRLGPGGLVILFPLLIETDEAEAADRIYRLFAEGGPVPDEVRLAYGYHLFNRRKYEEATRLLAPLVAPIRYAASDVTSAVELVADIKANPRLFSGQAKADAPALTVSRRTRDLLAIAAPDEFDLAAFSLNLVTDLNEFCFYPGATGEASAARMQEIAALFPTGLTSPQLNESAHEARLILAAICCYTKNRAGIEQLRLLASGQTRWLEGERYVYQALLGQEAKLSVTQERERMEAAVDLLPGNPVALMLAGDACLREKRYSTAIEYYSGACRTNAAFKQNPQLIEHFAAALMGEKKFVVGLRMVDSLHRRNYRSRNSLELMRDMGYQAGMIQVSLDAQQLLEQTYPGDWAIVLGGGNLRCKVNQPVEALAVYRRILDSAAEPAVKTAAQQGMLEAMLRTRKLQEIIELRLPEAVVGGYQAAAYALLGQDQRAIEMFQTLVQSEQMTPAWRLLYAAILEKNRRPLEAIGQLMVLLRQDPEDEAAHSELAGLFADLGDFRAAREHAQIALEHNESQVKALLVIAITDLYRQNAENAQMICQDLLRRDPEDSDARFLYACALNRLNKYDQALTELELCPKQDRTKLPYLRQRIEALAGKEDYDGAWRVLSEAAAQYPQDRDLQHAKVALSIQARQFVRAKEELGRAGLLDAQDKILLRSQIAYQQGDVAAALQILDEGQGLPRVDLRWAQLGYDLGKKAEIIRRLGEAKIDVRSFVPLAERAEESKDFPFARDLYRLALARSPDDPVILNNYAWAAFRCGEGTSPEVYAAAMKAAALCPDSSEVLATCGEITNASGRFTETISLLGRAPKRLFASAQLLGLMALAYEATGRYDEALKAYRRMQNLEDPSPYTSEQIQGLILKLKDRARDLPHE